MGTKTETSDVIFIEWQKSNLTWFKNYIDFEKAVCAHWVSLPYEKMELIFTEHTKYFIDGSSYSQLGEEDFLENVRETILEAIENKGNTHLFILCVHELVDIIVSDLRLNPIRPVTSKIYRLNHSDVTRSYIIEEKVYDDVCPYYLTSIF